MVQYYCSNCSRMAYSGGCSSQPDNAGSGLCYSIPGHCSGEAVQCSACLSPPLLPAITLQSMRCISITYIAACVCKSSKAIAHCEVGPFANGSPWIGHSRKRLGSYQCVRNQENQDQKGQWVWHCDRALRLTMCLKRSSAMDLDLDVQRVSVQQTA